MVSKIVPYMYTYPRFSICRSIIHDIMCTIIFYTLRSIWMHVWQDNGTKNCELHIFKFWDVISSLANGNFYIEIFHKIPFSHLLYKQTMMPWMQWQVIGDGCWLKTTYPWQRLGDMNSNGGLSCATNMFHNITQLCTNAMWGHESPWHYGLFIMRTSYILGVFNMSIAHNLIIHNNNWLLIQESRVRHGLWQPT